jgi:hypothetical protein
VVTQRPELEPPSGRRNVWEATGRRARLGTGYESVFAFRSRESDSSSDSFEDCASTIGGNESGIWLVRLNSARLRKRSRRCGLEKLGVGVLIGCWIGFGYGRTMSCLRVYVFPGMLTFRKGCGEAGESWFRTHAGLEI